jgi:formylglycine-generating enzyme required for sulfatase activity/serine/threonine protein kinase
VFCLSRSFDLAALNPRLGNPSGEDRRVPEQFGRYRIIKRLGQGGMGSVYLAQDTYLERAVALKVPDFGDHEVAEARRRFLEEARIAATLRHPYLCPVYDAGEIDGQLYLTMAYIEGQSLAALIGTEGWPQRQVAALVGKLALALQEAHAKKVIHRDLKPANVMIKVTGQRREPVIVDFGLARRDNRQEQRLTKSGQVMGTLGYMSPEQIRGDLTEIGPACDIYALGVILYELLTGRLPFNGSGLAVAGQILTQAPLPPSMHRGDLAPALEAICLKAMAKAVGDRYASMAELAAALTGFIHFLSASPTPTESVDSPTSPSPTSGQRPKPPGSDSLVRQFLGHLVENDPSPPAVPTPEPVASPAELPEHRRLPRPLMALAAVLGVLVLGAIIYVGTHSSRDKVENRDHASRSEPTEGPRVVRSPVDRDRTNGPVLNLKSTLTRTGSSAESLFNGSDLKGWTVAVGDVGMWRVENQTLVATEPDGQGQGTKGLGRLLTERSFKEFIFRFEYQSSSDIRFGAVWWTLTGEMPPVFHPSASTLGLATNHRGQSVFLNLKAIELKGGEGWNLVEIEARDRLIRISVNGKQIVRRILHERPAEPAALQTIKPDGAFPRVGMDRRNGHVGFQLSRGTGRFRNIEIEELSPSPVAERLSPKSAMEVEEHLVEDAADLPKPQPAAPGEAPKAITNSIEMKLTLIPAGTFLMGSPDEDKDGGNDERPPHPVRITHAFYMGATEVTRGQFRRFVEDTGYQTEGEKNGTGGWAWNEKSTIWEQNAQWTWRNPRFEQTDEHPVVQMSWNDAVAFAQWLSRKEGKTYRLPTEAEWEYACRARTTTRFSNGDNAEGLAAVGNVKDGTFKEKYPKLSMTIAARDGYLFTAPVGRFQPNAFGLYDMHGNATEWCSDAYAVDYYRRSPLDDPAATGGLGASDRMIRGGCWWYDYRKARSSWRWHFPPDARYSHLGFRVVQVSSGP